MPNIDDRIIGCVKVVCHESQATVVIEDTERGKPECGQFSASKHVDCIPTSAMRQTGTVNRSRFVRPGTLTHSDS
jgi:hypothetical protein